MPRKSHSFGRVRVDQMVWLDILKLIQPMALDAARDAAEQLAREQNDRTRAPQLELEQARSEARWLLALE
jgi:hypothetical protein